MPLPLEVDDERIIASLQQPLIAPQIVPIEMFTICIHCFSLSLSNSTPYALCTVLALAPLAEPPLLQSQQATTRRQKKAERCGDFWRCPPKVLVRSCSRWLKRLFLRVVLLLLHSTAAGVAAVGHDEHCTALHSARRSAPPRLPLLRSTAPPDPPASRLVCSALPTALRRPANSATDTRRTAVAH